MWYTKVRLIQDYVKSVPMLSSYATDPELIDEF